MCSSDLGAAPEPLLYDILDRAASSGKPGAFAQAIKDAGPSIEKIADPDTKAAFEGMKRVAQTANFLGWAGNIGAYKVSPIAGGALTAFSQAAPQFSGPSITWRALQSPAAQELLSKASALKPGSQALENISKQLTALLTNATEKQRAFEKNIPRFDLSQPQQTTPYNFTLESK